jgi:hypothetical protein
MAARRLLIVMLILLGLSTLAAALVPQHALRGGTTGSTTTTQTTQSTPAAAPPSGRSLKAPIVVGGKQPPPVVAGPVCKKPKPRCEPIHVGDQLSLMVYSRDPAQLEVPEFGLVGESARNAPAFFQLLFDRPENVGVLFSSTHRVAARIEVLSPKAAAKALEAATAKPKRRARGGSGPA